MGLSILFVGESCMAHHVEYKGYDSFAGTSYNEFGMIMRGLFEGLGHTFAHIPCHLVSRTFPRELKALQAYDLVLFSDVGANTFLLLPDMVKSGVRTPNLLRLVKEYVEAGGGFGMIGGYMTFQGFEAKAKYKDSHIEDILPVNLLPYDDRVEVPEGADLICESESPILSGLPRQYPVEPGVRQDAQKPGHDAHLPRDHPVAGTLLDRIDGPFGKSCGAHQKGHRILVVARQRGVDVSRTERDDLDPEGPAFTAEALAIADHGRLAGTVGPMPRQAANPGDARDTNQRSTPAFAEGTHIGKGICRRGQIGKAACRRWNHPRLLL